MAKHHLLMLSGLCFLFQLGPNRSLHMLFCLVPFLCLLNGLCLHDIFICFLSNFRNNSFHVFGMLDLICRVVRNSVFILYAFFN